MKLSLNIHNYFLEEEKALLRMMKYAVSTAIPVIVHEIGYTDISTV